MRSLNLRNTVEVVSNLNSLFPSIKLILSNLKISAFNLLVNRTKRFSAVIRSEDKSCNLFLGEEDEADLSTDVWAYKALGSMANIINKNTNILMGRRLFYFIVKEKPNFVKALTPACQTESFKLTFV
ncbi:hypothetical protein A3D05_02375 [Candidatus Gottesmanbacteria bacterium RIFCSPHIGHO2_02_FULL_40_24]|uniref:Uncharacterized protein n=1 Tax=Candidatus Gottesmanbacteria bacterium RIFCSPHIGHO2_01_FULL_40_15 TaxID=1798376 RepID=A0A1F5Z4E8_9BACT|nr:MAG: hypothetical protein A2777_03880 [Candidatus Gottesmanbacteria bacterium RIFCSPHIGHO2_01_FULL_40_15]OGG18697.1 MAG: hypothetical protein A3D05_02375 [Candidatus Gottesmanbacteria bacterium RIFCSPHIGHO2_02_FULL_40_24]OGG22989.1 MAG: hypothetical protein A3E42_06585 [Candidatus Gottesmanbacteria bacterium RIFCSPHIGHO2_12_FULL_40_13]OGG23300.1 MAG: hypothetical protein A3B48_06520 [Candidatus Gottesmanbacteria bacterium RIFCSPLOWO2_01_FULL_40_10]OGG31907.1 MAG: hypothetical protein A3I80_0